MPKSKRFSTRAEWKANYFQKLEDAIRNNSKFLLVNADNVTSKQFAQIRQNTRGRATIVMGKNTMMKKVIAGLLSEFPEYEAVSNKLVENVGFVFTNEDLKTIRDVVLENKIAAPARAGAIAPVSVTVPAQNTGLGPEKTSFFQALSIQTKIARGTIEIVSDVPLLKEGDKVGMSEATLLNMLKIFPFSYGLRAGRTSKAAACLRDPSSTQKFSTLLRKISELNSWPVSTGLPLLLSKLATQLSSLLHTALPTV